MSGLCENTAHFRIGDSTVSELAPYRAAIRGGGLGYEDNGHARGRCPADCAVRLIDVVVKVGAS